MAKADTRRPRPKSKTGAANSPKRGRGRPSDFRPEFCEQAEKLCKLHNATDDELAAFFEKDVATINRWKQRHPEFCESIARGKAVADMEIADSLFRRARGFEWDEDQAIKVKTVIYSDSGKKLKEEESVQIVKVHRVVPADTNACMAWLSNRQKEKWRNKVDHESGGKPFAPIILYADDEGL
jgi:hypothetical protein